MHLIVIVPLVNLDLQILDLFPNRVDLIVNFPRLFVGLLIIPRRKIHIVDLLVVLDEVEDLQKSDHCILDLAFDVVLS